MGVFCVDRTGTPVFGTSNLLWSLVGQVLTVLGAERVEQAFVRDGYVPSWLTRSWGDVLFADLGDAVLVCRPVHGRSELLPVGAYRRGTGAQAAWARAGEHLSVYDTPVASVLLSFAQTCTAARGFAVTTLRPPAPGSAPSEVAVRALLARSGLLPGARRRPPGRLGAARPHRPPHR